MSMLAFQISAQAKVDAEDCNVKLPDIRSAFEKLKSEGQKVFDYTVVVYNNKVYCFKFLCTMQRKEVYNLLGVSRVKDYDEIKDSKYAMDVWLKEDLVCY